MSLDFIMVLHFSQFLENYLDVVVDSNRVFGFSPLKQHLMLIVYYVNASLSLCHGADRESKKRKRAFLQLFRRSFVRFFWSSDDVRCLT